MNTKKALIFGISGQDGAFLSKILLEKGYFVIGTSRTLYTNPPENARVLSIESENIIYERACATRYDDVDSLIQKYNPTEIYNLGGQSSVGKSFDFPLETFNSNVTAVLNILEAVRKNDSKIRVFNAGSGDCYGGNDRPLTEKDPFKPTSPYGLSKVSASAVVTQYRELYGIHAVTGIMFNHESHLRPKQFVTQKIVTGASEIYLGSSKTLTLGDLSIYRDWGLAAEYCEAIWLMLQTDKPEDLIISTGVCMSLRSFVSVVFQTLGLNWENHVVSNTKLFRPSEIRKSYGNPLRLKNKLGWEASTIGSAVPEFLIRCALKAPN